MQADTLEALAAQLQEAQQRLEREIRVVLTQSLSARTGNAALEELLVTSLPMVQGLRWRILRSRGRGAIITARVCYRDGVRMLAGAPLTAMDEAALETARTIASMAMQQEDQRVRFDALYGWICSHIRYAHTNPGQNGYDQLVGATGVLLSGQGNCQGFADVTYLLCGLCGIPCEYRIGRGERLLHVWNAVCIGSAWQDVDASRGARELMN